MKEIRSLTKLNATVTIPGSKSITHRAIIAASLADGESLLKNFLKCEDTLYTVNALEKLGVDYSFDGEDLRVKGRGGAFQTAVTEKEIFLGNSGTSFRLLTSLFALGQGKFLMTGASRMLQRPIGPLVTALNQLGVDAFCVNKDDCPPVLINAEGIRGGSVNIAGDQSSQFLSSLLLSGPYAVNDIEIEITGKLVSSPYVDITTDVMKQFGVDVERYDYKTFRVCSGQKYMPREFIIQGDASSASYFWAAAAVTGGNVITKNIYPSVTRQGDIRFLQILQRMGADIKTEEDRVIIHGGRLSGIDADMGSMPDMVPTLAAIALFAEGKTTIRNVHHLRFKESDRLHCVALEWGRLGAHIEETDDGLTIYGGDSLKGAILDPHDDHRLAMSLAVVGLMVPGIKIKDEECVRKSFPKFWDMWDRL